LKSQKLKVERKSKAKNYAEITESAEFTEKIGKSRSLRCAARRATIRAEGIPDRLRKPGFADNKARTFNTEFTERRRQRAQRGAGKKKTEERFLCRFAGSA
jgi:hypothetical protein